MVVSLKGVESDRGVCVIRVAVVERIAEDRCPREEVVAIARRSEDCIGEDIHLAIAALAGDVLNAAIPPSCFAAKC